VIEHKVMGRGVAIDETKEGMVKVRMKNGVVETFYPEELETDEEVQARNKRISDEINRANKNRFDPYD
jgi:hypothetical protein